MDGSRTWSQPSPKTPTTASTIIPSSQACAQIEQSCRQPTRQMESQSLLGSQLPLQTFRITLGEHNPTKSIHHVKTKQAYN
jgi:hypothetical protein